MNNIRTKLIAGGISLSILVILILSGSATPSNGCSNNYGYGYGYNTCPTGSGSGITIHSSGNTVNTQNTTQTQGNDSSKIPSFNSSPGNTPLISPGQASPSYLGWIILGGIVFLVLVVVIIVYAFTKKEETNAQVSDMQPGV